MLRLQVHLPQHPHEPERPPVQLDPPALLQQPDCASERARAATVPHGKSTLRPYCVRITSGFRVNCLRIAS
jgi:hypothetical protein